MSEGAAARRADEKAEVARGRKRTSVIRGGIEAAAAPVVAGDTPSDGAGPRTVRSGASGVGAPAAATRRAEAEVEATVATEAGREVQNILAGRKIGVEGATAEAGGVGTALKARGRVRGPVAKTETDETSSPGAVCFSVFLYAAACVHVASEASLQQFTPISLLRKKKRKKDVPLMGCMKQRGKPKQSWFLCIQPLLVASWRDIRPMEHLYGSTVNVS